MNVRLSISVLALSTMLFVVVGVVPRRADAQCRTVCMPDEVRDGAGCCAAATNSAAGSRADGGTPGVSVDAAVTGSTVAAGSENVGCAEGRSRTADTSGQCCWPGQVWGGDRCRGIPSSCPRGHAANAQSESCDLQACPDGRERASDGVECCWPGQVLGGGTCRGVPSACPTNHVVDGESCTYRPPPAVCAGGRVATGPDAQHCCWPGQRWSTTAQACRGTPTSCAVGLVATDDDCTLAPSPVASVEGQGSDDSAQRRGRPDRYDSGAGRLALSPVGPVFMVLGGVSMGLAAISWAVADPIQRDLRVRCVDRGVCPFDVFARADAVRALDTLTNVGLIGGGVLMTTGLILLLAVRVPSGVTTSSVAVAPTLGGLSLHATF